MNKPTSLLLGVLVVELYMYFHFGWDKILFPDPEIISPLPDQRSQNVQQNYIRGIIQPLRPTQP